MSNKCFWLIEYLTIISVQQHQTFYRQQITLTGMMGIGRILHTHKSFSYCWCERIIHKVRTVLQTHSLHYALHTHFFFTNCQYQMRYILRRRLYVDWTCVGTCVGTCMGTCMGVVLVILIPFVFYRTTKYGKTLRGTTSVAPSSGGGGTPNDMPWRDKDEDFLQFAHLVILYAHAKCYPGNRHKRTQNR